MLYFSITSFGFDSGGKAYPKRICWQGRDIWLEAPSAENYVSFAINNSYYWLVKRRGKWQLLKKELIG